MKSLTAVPAVTNGPHSIRADDLDPRPQGVQEPGPAAGRSEVMTLICPKCHDTMRSYERNGVTVEQCAECRGIFLDRGELEHLVAAEARYNSAAPLPEAPPTPAASRAPDYDERRRSDRRYSDDDYYRGKAKKRKKSFLEEFFD